MHKFFRFQDLEVWQRAADISLSLSDVAERLEQKRRYRFAEQLRSAALSISNNIAEGTGSNSNNEFRNFLNYARRSAFECASMILVFQRSEIPSNENCNKLLAELNEICRMITALSRSLE